MTAYVCMHIGMGNSHRLWIEKEWHGDKDHIDRVVMRCNVRENASRHAAEQSSHLYLCSYLNRQNLISSNCHQTATVFCIQEDSIDVYIRAYDLRQRIFLDDITAEYTFNPTAGTVTLTWAVEDTRFGTGDDELVLDDVDVDLSKGGMNTSLALHPSEHPKTKHPAVDVFGTKEHDSGLEANTNHVQTISRLSDIEVAITVDMNVSPPVILVDIVNPFLNKHEARSTTK